jgi:hypothetical protein
MNPFAISERDVLNLGGRGGEPFVEFVNRLLRAEAAMAGRPSAAVTTLSVAERDGGVDARLDVARQATLDWFPTPTCWQFKSGPLPPKKAVAEINKPYVRELLRRGYTYRVAIRAGLTAQKRANLERALLAAARKIVPETLSPRVLDAGDLAVWCSTYPALVVAIFKPHLANVMHFETWRAVAHVSTPTFISDDRFDYVKAAVEEHTRFGETVASAVLTVGGAPGSGRGRLLFEALAAAELESLVLYADSEAQVDTLTTNFANETSTQAVLVAAECSAALREKIRARLSGSRNRIRVIAVVPPEVPVDRCDEWVDRPHPDTVKQIIDRNFSQINETKRDAFVHLGSPYLSIIIDLLERSSKVGKDGDLSRVIDPLSATLDAMLTSDERSALAAASLVDRLDIRPDSPTPLSAITAISDMPEQQLRLTLRALSERRLFTGDADDLIQVEPIAVASVLFRDAWQRWGEKIDGDDALRLPSLSRAAKCHDPAVRTDIAVRHEGWMYRITIGDFTTADTMRRFLLLVETDPVRYFPHFVRLMESAALDEVQRLPSRSDVTHLCDKLAGFRDLFDGVERILFRLALRETQTLANNATFYWTGLFAPVLSSTTVPFAERLDQLETRIGQATTPAELDLAFRGLSVVFSNHYWRVQPSEYVGGRLRPIEVLPSSDAFVESRWSAFQLLRRLTTSDRDDLRTRAVALVLDKLQFFISEGLLPEVRAILEPSVLTEGELQDALSTTRGFVAVYEDAPKPLPYLSEVREWIEELLPATPERDFWELFTRDQDVDELDDDARRVAPLLLRDDIDFAKVQRIVNRGNAYRAVLLGRALGAIDSDAKRLAEIIDAARPAQGFSFYRGYVDALVVSHPQHAGAINLLLDELEAVAPEVCAEIALGGGRATRALDRMTRLLRDDKVDPRRARDLAAVGEGGLAAAEFAGVIDLLGTKVDRLPSAADTGLDMIWWRLHAKNNADPVEIEAITRFIDSVTLSDASHDRRHWGTAMKELAKYDHATAVVLAAKGLGSANDQVQFHAEAILMKLAKNHPRAVTYAVGRALLNREGMGWHFLRLTGLYGVLPLEHVKEWLAGVGVEAARAVAPHLPWPKVKDGQILIHPLTEYVLGTFEEDDEVFAAFSRGVIFRSHSGDIAAEHEKEAEELRLFVNHPLRRIREWAADEVESAKRSAARWRQRKRRRLPR